MAYDKHLAERVREVFAGDVGISERKMFGGLAFLLHRHMAVVVSGEGGLMLRVEPADVDELVANGPARHAEMLGRKMTGWLRVDTDAVETQEELETWVASAVEFTGSLPPKD